LSWHEESGVSTDLSELRVSEAVLDNAVDEAKSYWMIFHLGVVKIVEQESGAFLDHNGIVPSVERRGGLKRNLMLDGGGREEVASHEYELEENLL
jgi:hypothetical protein